MYKVHIHTQAHIKIFDLIFPKLFTKFSILKHSYCHSMHWEILHDTNKFGTNSCKANNDICLGLF